MKIQMIQQGHPLWEKAASFAQHCSWKAGPVLAGRMREGAFHGWERVVVATDGENVAGYCTIAAKDELPEECGYTPFIGFVFVDEQYRGRRLSERMIDRACRYAKELGYPAAYIMSGEQGLYEKYGFQEIGDFRTVYGTTDRLFRRAL